MKPDRSDLTKAIGKGFTALLLFPLIARAQAGDWTQFHGPNGSGIPPDAKPPTTWSEPQNLKWKLLLPGAGTSSPILVGGKTFLTCWISGDASRLQRQLVCLNCETGKILRAMIPISTPPLRSRAGNSFCAPTGIFTASTRCRRRVRETDSNSKTL